MFRCAALLPIAAALDCAWRSAGAWADPSCALKGVEGGNLYGNLVGGLVAMNFIFTYIYIGCLIIPTDFHIFQRGGLTTNQVQF